MLHNELEILAKNIGELAVVINQLNDLMVENNELARND